MAFGIEILTPDGLVDATQTRAARLHSRKTFTSSSGTKTVSGFNVNIGFIHLRANDGKTCSSWQWNNSSKVLTIAPQAGATNPSTNMTALFLETG